MVMITKVQSNSYPHSNRTQHAALEITRLLPGLPLITMHLLSRGFTTKELDLILKDAVMQASQSFALEASHHA